MNAQPPLGPEVPAIPEPFFHLASGTVRFWVLVGHQYVGSSIRHDVLHYRYHPHKTDDEPLATYAENAAELHAAVRRRVAKGSIEPVMLRGPDLQVAPPS
jgi:hypothetical protein